MSMRGSLLGSCLFLLACTPPDDPDAAGPSVEVAAGNLERSVDAARSPDGAATYFLGDVSGTSGLHQTDPDGPPRAISSDLIGATSLVITSDGAAAIVAAEHDGDRGLARVNLADGALTWLDADGRAARGLDLTRGESGDVITFTGADADGPAVFRLDLTSPALERIASFPADAELDGVAQAADGALFVADRRGKIWHASAATAPTEILADVILGAPAGIALTLDESTLLISSLSAAGTSQVILLDTAAFTTAIFADVIGENIGSGGVHRALDADLFAWAGVTKPRPGEGTGVVYDIGL